MAAVCPCCSVQLTRLVYQGFAVLRCEQCHGHLVRGDRLQTIKCLRHSPVEELKQEVLSERGEDTKGVLRCPECHKRMRKHLVKPPAAFRLDVCDHCRAVWLDGGELARLQLAHRASQQGQEAAELQRRYREMTPEEKAALDKKVASLQENPDEQVTAEDWLDWASSLLPALFRLPLVL